MLKENEYCLNQNCGCRSDTFPSGKECPNCGQRLRLSGRSQLLEFRLICQNCGYQSHLLSQEEVQVLL